MLYAQINPTSKTVKQISPFQTEVVESDYMTVLARPYAAGASKVNFEIIFGTVMIDDQGVAISFNRTMNTNVIMTKDELDTWGLDDTVLLSLVANKIGTTVSNFVTIDN